MSAKSRLEREIAWAKTKIRPDGTVDMQVREQLRFLDVLFEARAAGHDVTQWSPVRQANLEAACRCRSGWCTGCGGS